MDLKPALKSQYHAALSMLRQCIERCPDEMWTAGAEPRPYWRICYHALFYTHFYLQDDCDSFVPWPKHRIAAAGLWLDDDEAPDTGAPYTKEELLEYADIIEKAIDERVDAMDLDSPESGFPWYPISKVEHQLSSLRHTQGHVGQLSELLMAADFDIDWFGRDKRKG